MAVFAHRAKLIKTSSDSSVQLVSLDGKIAMVPKGKYKEEDLLLFIPHGAIIPAKMLQEMGFWNKKQKKGTLSGKRGDTVEIKEFDGYPLEGIAYKPLPVSWYKYISLALFDSFLVALFASMVPVLITLIMLAILMIMLGLILATIPSELKEEKDYTSELGLAFVKAEVALTSVVA